MKSLVHTGHHHRHHQGFVTNSPLAWLCSGKQASSSSSWTRCPPTCTSSLVCTCPSLAARPSSEEASWWIKAPLKPTHAHSLLMDRDLNPQPALELPHIGLSPLTLTTMCG